jgi:Fe-S oxidoreductase
VSDVGLEQKHELGLCVQCGKCTGSCPVSTGSRLNIRRLMRDALLTPEVEACAGGGELWNCTTCSACRMRCPKGLKPVDVVVDLRRALVEEGKIPRTVQEALEAVDVHGNPWGRNKRKRALWAEGLDVTMLDEGQRAETLFFVGCAASYDERVQKVARAVAGCLRRGGPEFAILGDRERCCGHEVRRMGEEGLFEVLAEENAELLKSSAGMLVTTSPHCYNAFANDYSGLDMPVMHYTQLLHDRIQSGSLKPARELSASVAYHDPCFLGKQNGVYEEPREVLKAIPALTLLEFDRSRERSLCCGGGGGRMWYEGEEGEERKAETRVREAVEMGATILATACPFCLLTMEDAAKTTGVEEKIRIADIAELVCEAI